MSQDSPKSSEETGQIFRQESGLARLPANESPALSEIINRSLIHIQTSRTLTARHRIGSHELCDPDYRLVCSWAEELKLTQDDVLERLLTYPYMRSTLVDGRFKELRVDQGFLEISGLPSISGLQIEFLEICDSGVDTEGTEKPLMSLDLSSLSGLTELTCSGNSLTTLDLSLVPNLVYLNCWNNGLTELDLSSVPDLITLQCSNNKLRKLDLSAVPSLKKLYCSNCYLVDLDLSRVPELTHLDCSAYWGDRRSRGTDLGFYEFSRQNKLSELDLSFVPFLTDLDCSGNPLKCLDLSGINNLINLKCDSPDGNEIRTVQRTDQNFK